MARYDFATHRLYVPGLYAPGAILALEATQLNYLAGVLRMGDGAKLLAFNGEDGEWQAVFRLIGRKKGALELIAPLRAQTPRATLRYAFAPLKTARLEYMVQKAVEMGAGALLPVKTHRTQTHGLKEAKLRAYVIEAAEQCGVLSLAKIEPETTLETFLVTLSPDELLVFCDEAAEPADPLPILRRFSPAGAISVLVGPEGGFDEVEREKILAHPKLARLSLGPRILRADTAAVAALAAVQIALGDWTEG